MLTETVMNIVVFSGLDDLLGVRAILGTWQ
jgi:hypothetical protein